ncbi:MAG: hypothetical protein ACTTKL_05830 [Treponema sp.]
MNIKKIYFIMLLSIVVLMSSCGEDKAITIIKNSYLDDFPQKTIGNAVRSFFKEGDKWVSIRSENDDKVKVVCEGAYLVGESPNRLSISFLYDETAKTFELSEMSAYAGLIFSPAMQLEILCEIYELSAAEKNTMLFDAWITELKEFLEMARTINNTTDGKEAEQLYNEMRERYENVEEYSNKIDEDSLSAEQTELAKSLLWELALIN